MTDFKPSYKGFGNSDGLTKNKPVLHLQEQDHVTTNTTSTTPSPRGHA